MTQISHQSFRRTVFLSRANGAGARRLVDDDAADVILTAWSPDGREVAALVTGLDGPGSVGVYAIAVDDVEPRRLHAVPNARVHRMAWLSSQILLLIETTPVVPGPYEVIVVNPDGGAEKLAEGYGDGAAWSPDGAMVAYTVRGDGRDVQELELRVLDRASGSVTSIARIRGGSRIVDWTADGLRYVDGTEAWVVRPPSVERQRAEPTSSATTTVASVIEPDC